MNDILLERLRIALAASYEVLSELGHGGMARVFLARDLRHPRRVAVKVLYPELTATIGSERLLREIAVTASLSHPHILPLLDSGQADGLLYYTMPFVDGETLRTRLDREGMLRIEEAVEIAGQVGAALAYAHMHGVIHRDIKPDNILLSGNQAVLADFGIAHAVADIGAEHLTETGLAIGTVIYMSPEQSVSDPQIDGRSDQYSLACVTYEMLVGQPPFSGRNSRAIIARHTVDAVPPIRTIRSTVPPEVERAVLRGLAKQPVDRFPSMTAFVEALEAGLVGSPAAGPVHVSATPRRVVRLALAGTALSLAISAVLLQRACSGIGGPDVDQNLVAILPFRIGGDVDTTLLAPAGITELLNSALSGGPALHAVDPARTLPAWRRATSGRPDPLDDLSAIRLARTLGAGKLLLGQVYGTRDSLLLSARLLAVPGGNELARVDRIAGTKADALGLLEQLTVQLLARDAGQKGPRLEDLYTRNVHAFRAYMAGAEQYRRGRYIEAAQHYQSAVGFDSTFALAALHLGLALALMDRTDEAGAATAIAWTHRDRLGPSGRMFLRAMAGANYPEPSSMLEDMDLWERTADSIPERAEASYELGDILYHFGTAVGRRSALLLAANAFRRALEGDSALAPALEHLMEISAAQGDTADVRRLGRRYFAVDSLGDRADYVRWRVAVALQDSAGHRAIRERLPAFSDDVLKRVITTAQRDGVALDDAMVAAAELLTRARNPSQLWGARLNRYELAINLGRPGEAPALTTHQGFRLPVAELFTAVSAIYWDGDSASAAEAVRRRRSATAKRPSPVGDPTSPVYTDACTVGLWAAAQGNWEHAAREGRTLRTAKVKGRGTRTQYITVCEAIISAQLAWGVRRPDAAAQLTRLDSLMVTLFPEGGAYLVLAGNLTAARLFEAARNIPAALAAVSRRTYLHDSFGVAGLSTLLREEGRLSVLAGDREAAIRAYQHYLRLRRNPEPRLAPQVNDVRRALAELLTDRPQ